MTEQHFGTGTYTCGEFGCGFGSESYAEWKAHRDGAH